MNQPNDFYHDLNRNNANFLLFVMAIRLTLYFQIIIMALFFIELSPTSLCKEETPQELGKVENQFMESLSK